MNVVDIPLEQIEVGERRRTDFGDIGALAYGMQRVGLIEPIVVDRNGAKDRYRLLAGERRLRAARMLKWTVIPASLREHLTDPEMRELELEENENRKSLTERERARTFTSAKRIVESAKKAQEVLARSGPKPDQKGTPGGRPADTNSTRAVAAALGTSRQAVDRAQKQVVLSERYSFLQTWRQADVLKFEQHLKRLDAKEQAEFCDFIVRNYAPLQPRPDQAIEVAEVLTVKNAKARAAVYELSKSGDKRERDLAATRSRQRPPMPDPRIMILDDAVKALYKAHNAPYDKDPEASDIREAWKFTTKILTAMRCDYDRRKKEEEEHVESDVR